MKVTIDGFESTIDGAGLALGRRALNEILGRSDITETLLLSEVEGLQVLADLLNAEKEAFEDAKARALR